VADKSTDEGEGLGVLLPGSTYPSLADNHRVVF
jgi:hypothetical protein